MSCALAISTSAVAAARVGSATLWQRDLTALDGSNWPSLSAALRDGVAAGAITSPVRIALLPPLVEVRAVSIPPVGEEDARRLLTRAASRHFVSANEPMTVGVAPLASAASGGARLAVAVPARVLRAVMEAARENGLAVEVVVPAQVALAAEQRSAKGANPNASLLVPFGDALELISVQHGVPVAVRRFRRTGDDDVLAEALASSGAPRRVEDVLESAARALSSHAGSVSTHTSWPLALGDTAGLTTHAQRSDRRSWWLFAGAAALAVGVVALQELDVRRELEAVRAQRAALAPALLSVQGASGGADGRAEALTVALQQGPRWSRVLADLSDALPTEVYITHLRARADTLVVEGNAVQASAAYDALASAPWVHSIAASAPVRRETADDGSVTEKFEFTLTLRGKP